MAGTKAGGQKCKQRLLERYGEDYFSKLGKIGGSRTGSAKGFAANPELASRAGKLGGSISRRGPAKKSMVRKVNDGESLAEGNN